MPPYTVYRHFFSSFSSSFSLFHSFARPIKRRREIWRGAYRCPIARWKPDFPTTSVEKWYVQDISVFERGGAIAALIGAWQSALIKIAFCHRLEQKRIDVLMARYWRDSTRWQNIPRRSGTKINCFDISILNGVQYVCWLQHVINADLFLSSDIYNLRTMYTYMVLDEWWQLMYSQNLNLNIMITGYRKDFDKILIIYCLCDEIFSRL